MCSNTLRYIILTRDRMSYTLGFLFVLRMIDDDGFLGVHNIQFNLFPAHIEISYNNDNVHIMCMKRGEQKTELMNVRSLTITNY